MRTPNIPQLLRNYFGFTRIEARGFWIWTVGMLLLFIFNLSFSWFNTPTKPISRQEQAIFNEILATLKQNDSTNKPHVGLPHQPFGTEVEINTQGERFVFDPNTATEDALKKLGIPTRFIKSIVKYRNKGGKFKKKADLKKIYNFPENVYASLESYIDLPEESIRKEEKYKDNSEIQRKHKPLPETNKRRYAEIKPFDLNTADTATLSQIRGIGAKTAQNIVDYREKLGGFIRTDQLQEVSLLRDKPEIISELLRYAHLENTTIRKMNVNTASLEAMKAHPYFAPLAKYLLVCRDKNKFTSLEEVQKLKAVTPEIWQKMKDYITIQ